MTTPNAAASEALDRCEREDPVGHAMHLAAAGMWGFCQSIANTPEGIAWGVLVVVTLLRLPKIHGAFGPIVRNPAWLLFVLWMLWIITSTAWSHPEVDRVDALRPVRWVITPLLLWPVMGYPWLVLGSIAAGGFVQVLATLAMSIGPEGPMVGVSMRSITGFSELQIVAGTLLAISIASLNGVSTSNWKTRIPMFFAIPASSMVILQSGGRGSLASAIAITSILMLRPKRSGWKGRLLLLGCVSSAILAIAASIGIESFAISRSAAEYREAVSADGDLDVGRLGSSRGLLWMVAWEKGTDRPYLGHGRHSYAPLLREWLSERKAEELGGDSRVESLARLNHPHNSYVNAWIEGGIPGLILFSGGIALLSWLVWRRSAADACLAAAAALMAMVQVNAWIGVAEMKQCGALMAISMALVSRRVGSGQG